MKVELFALCDFAADYGGKLSVMAVFDTLFARQTPVVHPHCCIAVKLRFEKIEEGQKRLRLSVTDADGKPVLPAVESPLEVAMPASEHTSTVQVVANIGGIKFESFGEYSIDLAIDGRQEGSIPLFVRAHPQPGR
ncbi:MAG: hypothetical protein ABSC03_04180 [Verrucomicrobiota bacterium]|jgi:hypothetical protein